MIYEIKNPMLSLKIDRMGAQMISLSDDEGTEYLWQGDKSTWDEHAPNLFPYIARLTDGKYTYKGKTYEMQIHGLAKYTEMKTAFKTDNQIEFMLSSNSETIEHYPFKFRFYVKYTLIDSKVKITYRVVNDDDRQMYFGIGGHPGFNVPVESNLNFEDYKLEFSEECGPVQIGFTEKCFVSGEDKPFELEHDRSLKLNHSLFDNDAIVLKNMSKSVVLSSDKGMKKIKVTYPDMDYLGLWHWPKTRINYICIEPWSSLPSRQDIVEDIEYQDNLISLDCNSVYTNKWEIEIIK